MELEALGLGEKELIGPTQLAWLGQALGAIDFFSHLTPAEIDAILPSISLYRVPAGRRLIREGDLEQALFVIHEGEVLVTKREAFFFQRKVARLGDGEFFGEMALLHQEKRSATVKTTAPSKIFVLLSKDFDFVL